MEHIRVTDEWLYRYMPVVDQALIQALEARTDYGYRFSRKFERKMKAMIWKESHLWTKAAYRHLKRAAALLCCVIVSAYLLSMSAEGNRIKFFETVQRFLEDNSVERTFMTDEAHGPLTFREPAWLPEGYRETERHTSEIGLLLNYENSSGEMITWKQSLATDVNAIVMDTEYDSRETREVDGKYVTVCSYSDGFRYAYCEYQEAFYLVTADCLTVDEICQMFRFSETE